MKILLRKEIPLNSVVSLGDTSLSFRCLEKPSTTGRGKRRVWLQVRAPKKGKWSPCLVFASKYNVHLAFEETR